MLPPATEPDADRRSDPGGVAVDAAPADDPELARRVDPQLARRVDPQLARGVAAGVGDGQTPDVGSARPVALHLVPELHEPLARWVEGVLGWQVVDRQTGALVPPTVRLVDADADPPADGVPRVLVVADAGPRDGAGDGAGGAAAAVRLQPAGVIAWPTQRDALPAVVAAAVDAARPAQDGAAQVRIGGVAGGVGTTTVTLAVAGLAAWRGSRVLASVRGDAPTAQALVVPADAVAAPDLWGRLDEVSGAEGLRVVHVADPAPVPAPRDPAVEIAVLDHGVDVDVDVLVCRPDAAALQGVAVTTAAVIVVVGDGPLRAQELRDRAGGRRIVPLPWSARVARAGLRRRVPTALPGAWLRGLVPLLPAPSSRRSPAHRLAPPDD